MHKNIDKIKNLESPPRVIKNLFEKNEIEKFFNLYNELPTTVHNKKQNVIKKRWLKNYSNELENLFYSKVKNEIGDFRMDNLKDEKNEDILGLFQESYNPIGLHVDAGFNLDEIIFKQTLIPLTSKGSTVIFKNKFYGNSTNFTTDENELKIREEKMKERQLEELKQKEREAAKKMQENKPKSKNFFEEVADVVSGTLSTIQKQGSKLFDINTYIQEECKNKSKAECKKIKDEKTGDEKNKVYRFLKISWAYNSEQVNLENSSWKVPTPKKIINQVDENENIENFVKNQMGLNLQYSNKDRCFYNTKLDYIHMSNKFNFEPTKNGTSATLEYYSTLLHELTHWTGSEKRLNRFEKNKKYFDNNAELEYALEELIAEIGANILCCKFNIQKTINKNSLAYLKSWISRLKNDKLFILKSLTQSGQAVNFLKDNLKTNIKAVKTA